ncbi:MAG TPA: DNA translocase FtsK 4TM domain-containing protein [Gemmatimonadaceae bacterium]|nr:DNA translocase FtsK 4TM domain-containing protein [Gemmatimonadaceae bacterium]
MSSGLRRELQGIAVLLLAVFVAGTLALQPVPDDGSCFAGRGIFGPVGACLKWSVIALIGLPAAWLVPLAGLVHGLRLLGTLEADTDRSWMIFLLGLAVLVPVGVGLAAPDPRDATTIAGNLGGFIAYYLLQFFGRAGAWILVALALSTLMAWTLRWNPVRAIVARPASRPRGTTAAGGTAVALELEPPPQEMPGINDRAPSPATLPTPADAPTSAARSERKRRERAPTVPAPEPAASALATEVLPADGIGEDALAEVLPPPDLLTAAPQQNVDVGRRELDAMGQKLMEALRTFRVEGELLGRTTGPVVTQFEIEPAPGVKVRQFANLANDLALAMRAPSIRVVAPIPGRGAVGVEVPNPTPEHVWFREIIESNEFKSARASLPIVLGKNLEGHPVVADLARMPHLLIAGATGSGKSVCVNTIITSLMYRHTPATLRFLMVDPKMVELSVYNRVPHLKYKVITDNRDAASILKWAVMEMHDRYHLLAANGARNIQEFNKRVQDGAHLVRPRNVDVAFEDRTYRDGIQPYIVIVIDELADLMMTVQGEVETPLALLAQKARAIGIHLILATQRPSVNVITGLIKANFPSRIAFRVASQVDSRTIIDGIGAESLLGNGDMLFIPPGKSEPQRIQGAFIPGEDTERLMAWYEQRRAARRASLAAKGLATEDTKDEDLLKIVRDREAMAAAEEEDDDRVAEGERDDLFRRAAEVCIQHQLGSTSLLQRRLGIGYGRAARIIDQLHHAGVLGPPNGSKPRDILVGLEELDRICGPEMP